MCVLFLVKPTKLLHCPDSDNDGFCDNRELAEGTDPNGPENFPAPPFPEDAARYVYFGGFDANFLDAHNTAWIFRYYGVSKKYVSVSINKLTLFMQSPSISLHAATLGLFMRNDLY